MAYEAAQRALDKQERLLEELRSRTGVLLAAAALGASFLGREAFAGNPKRGLAIGALVALLVAIAASVYILVPKANKFVFAVVGGGLYEGLYAIKEDLLRSIVDSPTISTASGTEMTARCRSSSPPSD